MTTEGCQTAARRRAMEVATRIPHDLRYDVAVFIDKGKTSRKLSDAYRSPDRAALLDVIEAAMKSADVRDAVFQLAGVPNPANADDNPYYAE